MPVHLSLGVLVYIQRGLKRDGRKVLVHGDDVPLVQALDMVLMKNCLPWWGNA